MKTIGIIVALLVSSVNLSVAQTNISENSKVKFNISNMLINTVDGTFKGMEGTVKFDANNLDNSMFDVCIDASTINTGIDLRDKDLKSDRFFHVDKYPKICFRSSNISKTSEGYTTTGQLTMHGVTNEVKIPFTVSDNSLSGTFTLNRLDYNVGETTGTFMVGDEVTVSIDCQVKESELFSSE